jgi:hypothetical protein
MEGVLTESSSVLLLASAERGVAQGKGGCNGHILNRWHMQIWFIVVVLGELDEVTNDVIA